jgi:hypothetical protein
MIVPLISTLAKAARVAMADSMAGAATSLQITAMVMAARPAPATRISMVVALAVGDRAEPRLFRSSSPEIPGIFDSPLVAYSNRRDRSSHVRMI